MGVGGIPLGGGPILSETLEVVMGKGPSAHAPDIYDAHDIVRSIQP